MTNLDFSVLAMRLLFGLIIGSVLVGFFAIWGLVPLWLGITFPICTGLLAVIFGDQFLLGFMRVFRWFR